MWLPEKCGTTWRIVKTDAATGNEEAANYLASWIEPLKNAS
jgi:hypothetical protein